MSQPRRIEAIHASSADHVHVDFESYFNSPRPRLLTLLQDHVPHKALEIGCGAAANLFTLKQRFPSCETVGVERDASAAKHGRNAQAADEILVGDVLDTDTIDFPAGTFDLVLLSHVLEHFDDPGQVIRRALSWLHPDGRLLVALPNVRHYSVVYDLIVGGDFRYRRDGILDRTHLRFFTRRSAARFFQHQGLEIIASAPDIEGRGSRLLSAVTFRWADEFAAYAYNFLLRRGEPCAS